LKVLGALLVIGQLVVRPARMPLRPISFESETAIRYEFQLETFEKERCPCRILIAKFAGDYRPGHLGAPDGWFIRGITEAALRVWCPDALTLDFRELSYTWGDEMEEILGIRGEIKVPFAIVGSELCLPAIGTLIQVFYGAEKIKTATDAENIFDNMEEALEYVHQKV
jgi:hypothetical protein